MKAMLRMPAIRKLIAAPFRASGMSASSFSSRSPAISTSASVSPALFRALGIFLPLITTNCAILGLALFQTNRGYGFIEGVAFALGAGCGLTLALVLMAGIREENEFGSLPEALKGTAMSFLIAGILSMAFMGFAGLFSKVS